MERGLRQGYPLSALLFNLVVEALPRFLIQFQSAGWLSGVAIPGLRNEMLVLQFVDDTILFLNNTEGLLLRIQSCLLFFPMMTGFKINLSKSSIIEVG